MEQISFSWFVYIIMLILISFSRFHKSVITLSAAAIFFISRYITVEDISKYSLINLKFIITVIGISIISSFLKQSGIFQILIFKAVKISNYNYKKLKLNICIVMLLLSSFYCDRMAVVTLFPIIAFIYDSLKFEINNTIIESLNSTSIGGMLFSFSGIEVILISTFAGITFLDYLLNITPALVVFFLIYLFYSYKFSSNYVVTNDNMQFIKFNEKMILSNYDNYEKILLILTFMLVLMCFNNITGFSDAVVILVIATILFLFINLPPDLILKSLKFNIFLYLFGLQIVTTVFYKYHIYNKLANYFLTLTNKDGFYLSLLILFLGVICSLLFGRLAMTFFFVPIISVLELNSMPTLPLYSALIFSMTFARAPTMLREIPKVLQNTHIEENKIWEHYFNLVKKTSFIHLICFIWFALYIYIKFFYF